MEDFTPLDEHNGIKIGDVAEEWLPCANGPVQYRTFRVTRIYKHNGFVMIGDDEETVNSEHVRLPKKP